MSDAIIYLDPDNKLNPQNQIRQKLVAEGYLVSRQRSGVFVSQEILDLRVGHSEESSSERVVENAG